VRRIVVDADELETANERISKRFNLPKLENIAAEPAKN
jgi:hypothetical protein